MNKAESKYHKGRWIITSPDGVSFSGLEEIKVERTKDNRGRERTVIAKEPHPTTITVNTLKDEIHPGSGMTLQPREFFIQLTELNKNWLVLALKKEWIIMDDEELEDKLIADDGAEDATFTEVEPEEEEKPKSTKSQKRLANLKA